MLTGPKMQIYGVHMNQVFSETDFQEMIQCVSSEKQAKILRFRKPIDAARSLLGDVIIRYILCKHYGFHNDEISYGYEECGKPYLPQHPDIHFNISHSGDWVVGIVSNNSVGIDIEKITEIKPELSSLAFTEEENKKLQTLNERQRNTLFFELWTLKESYVKATGTGLSEGLNTLEVSINNEMISIKKDEKPVPAYFEILKCIEGYQLSVCSLSQPLDKDINLFQLDECKEELKNVLKYSQNPISII